MDNNNNGMNNDFDIDMNNQTSSELNNEEQAANNQAIEGAVEARRRALAEALRDGQPVVVSPSGEVEFKDEMDENQSGIQVPDGKLA